MSYACRWLWGDGRRGKRGTRLQDSEAGATNCVATETKEGRYLVWMCACYMCLVIISGWLIPALTLLPLLPLLFLSSPLSLLSHLFVSLPPSQVSSWREVAATVEEVRGLWPVGPVPCGAGLSQPGADWQCQPLQRYTLMSGNTVLGSHPLFNMVPLVYYCQLKPRNTCNREVRLVN